MSEITANKVIAVAMKQIGYKEKKNNSQLDNKTANAGSNNYTKYARDFDQKYPNWYNGKKNGFSWCDMFVDWCFLTAFGYEKALELLCQSEKSAGAGCKYSYQYYKNKGQAGRVPKIGAQIFFGNTESEINHTGIVYKIDNAYVYTIEGNTSNCAAYRKYSREATRLWYGYPKYENTIITDIPEQATTTDLSIGSTGATVKEMQIMLIKLGYSCGNGGADGDFGNNTQTALKKFQKNNGLAIDGIYGPKSKAKLTKLYKAAIKIPNKTIEQIAKEVISGKWGRAEDRKRKLQTAGYDYRTVQTKVNEILRKTSKPSQPAATINIKTDPATSFNKNIAKTYTTTANLRLRTGANTSKPIIVVIPKGEKVTCYGYYTGNWYYVKYKNDAGYCSKQYLK